MSVTWTEREERVAKAISLGKGNTPDQVSESTSLVGGGVPKWRDYLQEARVFICAFDAAAEDLEVEGGLF